MQFSTICNGSCDSASFKSSKHIDRRVFLLGSSAATLFGSQASAQQRWNQSLKGSCSFYPDDIIDAEIYTFNSNQEALEIVGRICEAVGLSQNFEVMAANVPNAAAAIRGEKRYILYSQAFINQINQQTSTEWAGWTIMAHEVGHHLNGHTLQSGGSRPEIELQADRFAGKAVRFLGGNLQQALSPYNTMNPQGSSTHPPRSARIEAVTAGYGAEQNPPPPPSLSPQETLSQLINSLLQGKFPSLPMTQDVRQVMQMQGPAVMTALQYRGSIVNIQAAGSQPIQGGATLYVFQVMHQNGFTNWQMTLDANGTISYIYFQ